MSVGSDEERGERYLKKQRGGLRRREGSRGKDGEREEGEGSLGEGEGGEDEMEVKGGRKS